MSDIFDSPEVLIGDEGSTVLARSKADQLLSSIFKKILFPPKIPADLSFTPEEQWPESCVVAGAEWWHAWQQLSNRDPSDYINLLTALPDVFLNTHWLDAGCRGTLPYQQIKLRHHGTAAWMRCLMNSDVILGSLWDDYKPYGLKAKALLDLCIAVFAYKDGNCLFNGALELFTSPEHLWFWCNVARCMRSLHDQGLAAPLLSTELQNKQTLLAKNQANTEWLKLRHVAVGNTFCTGWQDFLEHLDTYLIREAMKGCYIENDKSDPLDAFIKVNEHTRNIFRRSKIYQASCLYRFPTESIVRTFTTAQNVKLPKPKRKRRK